MDFARRIEDPEIMDTLECGERELRKALSFLEITNRHFGGNAVLLKHLSSFARRWKPDEKIRILDVGAGLGDLDVSILKWARSRGFNLSITALEKAPQIAKMAVELGTEFNNLEIVQGDILDWPLDRRFDYVIASLFLHHVPAPSIAPILQKLDKIAGRGIILSDLRRSRSGYCAVKALSNLLGNRIVRNDGPLSVRRAFTVEELRALARENGLHYLRSRPEPFFRLSLAGEK